jgi:hypothetical protein
MAISDALRSKLLKQKEDRGFTPNDRLIDNKSVTEDGIVVRLLPANSEDPSLGEDFKSYYCQTLNTGTTSPLSFHKACPIADALDNIWQSDDNELKEHAKTFVNTQNEIWIPVILRGADTEEKIRILRCKASIYNQIVDWAMDERFSAMHDPQNGCDLLIKKVGKGLQTRWSVDRLGQSPLFEDEALVAEVVELAHKFDVRNSFFSFNLEKISQIYEGLTGEDLPGRYHDDLDGFNPRTDMAKTEVAEEVPPVVTEKSAARKDLDELLDSPAPKSSWAGRKCKFEGDDGETVFGTVLGVDDEDPQNLLVVEAGGDSDEAWSIPLTEMSIFAEEEEEVKPKAKRKAKRKPSRKASDTIRSKASKA